MTDGFPQALLLVSLLASSPPLPQVSLDEARAHIRKASQSGTTAVSDQLHIANGTLDICA